eukprot:CAMPEP_0206056126 /NCGR_PEP_ID=MMETSP1466-20131121/41520_1 /ASSEMBLY_ACC=CAM_ASM_001126 /TAXON_ID=44452 /ORGANISM="Pavlova gyrans, Strain CCMP608" /LENGTH=60 /DNA_ID=CAMNT_0053431359 /DNA_START=100 /DNA_END=282 /DNA_ORIENTATION=+
MTIDLPGSVAPPGRGGAAQTAAGALSGAGADTVTQTPTLVSRCPPAQAQPRWDSQWQTHT